MKDPSKPDRYVHTTNTDWEFRFGYSRALRHGRTVRVAGTWGVDEQGNPVRGGAGEQARRALEIIEEALRSLGADFSDVIMTRVYLKDVSDLQEVAVIHGQVFRDIRPATTIVKTDFIDPRVLVEIEMEAVYGGKEESYTDPTAR
jgi:enamine deaminase RidA (YjgF/YER057c/UK114 family)